MTLAQILVTSCRKLPEKRRAGGDILGALPPNPWPWRAALASVLRSVANLQLQPTASLIVKVLCGALLVMGDEHNEKWPSLIAPLSGSYFLDSFQ